MGTGPATETRGISPEYERVGEGSWQKCMISAKENPESQDCEVTESTDSIPS